MNGQGNSRDGDQYRRPVSYGENPRGYGNGPGYGTPTVQPRNGFGIAALVLGLLGLVLWWTMVGGVIFGILAVVFGLLRRAGAKWGEAATGGVGAAGVV